MNISKKKKSKTQVPSVIFPSCFISIEVSVQAHSLSVILSLLYFVLSLCEKNPLTITSHCLWSSYSWPYLSLEVSGFSLLVECWVYTPLLVPGWSLEQLLVLTYNFFWSWTSVKYFALGHNKVRILQGWIVLNNDWVDDEANLLLVFRVVFLMALKLERKTTNHIIQGWPGC